MSGKFTAKEHKFINEYVKCLDAAKAARRAGYSVKTARQIGYENLTKPYIKNEVVKIIKENTISPEEVLQQLTRMATFDIEDVYDFPKNIPVFNADKAKTNGAMQIIEGFKITDKEMTIKLPSKQKALELMAKYHGLLADTLRVETWQDRAIDDIRNDRITFQELEGLFDNDLAVELFARAGKSVQISEVSEQS